MPFANTPTRVSLTNALYRARSRVTLERDKNQATHWILIVSHPPGARTVFQPAPWAEARHEQSLMILQTALDILGLPESLQKQARQEAKKSVGEIPVRLSYLAGLFGLHQPSSSQRRGGLKSRKINKSRQGA